MYPRLMEFVKQSMHSPMNWDDSMHDLQSLFQSANTMQINTPQQFTV